jgi:two-component system chemotaxis response regulator CheY
MTGEQHYANKSAIVLDDNPQMRGILRSILAQMGFPSIAEFSEPVSTHRYLQSHHVDVAVLDLVLNSTMDGLDLALSIRHDPMIVNPTMPIILVTGYADAAVIDQVINYGVDEVVTKPLRARDLMARVEKTILRPRPYIRTPSGYFGPDRRRRIDPMYSGPERRQFDLADVVGSPTEARRAIARRRPDPVAEQAAIDDSVIVLD